MDYKYYLIDYYDFIFLKELNEQDMLGLASGYELYGYLNDTCTWKPGGKRHFLNHDFRGRWYAGEEEKMSEGEKGVLLKTAFGVFLKCCFYYTHSLTEPPACAARKHQSACSDRKSDFISKDSSMKLF